MKQGQAGLEYIYIIGIVAAGLIGMIFYVSRSQQGNLRSEADQLSESQYAPGKTRIHNFEDKNLKSSVTASATTTTVHAEKDPVGEKNVALENALKDIGSAWGTIYTTLNEWEISVVWEAQTEATKVRQYLWPWKQPEDGRCWLIKNLYLPQDEKVRDDAIAAADKAAKDWPERNPDKTFSGSSSYETGKITTDKTINEALDSL